jgi:hypothetical protein
MKLTVPFDCLIYLLDFFVLFLLINKPFVSKVGNNNECVLFNKINHHQENKAELKLQQQNLTSQILPVCSVYLQKRTYLHFVLKNMYENIKNENSTEKCEQNVNVRSDS